jgi:hypothetical protein
MRDYAKVSPKFWTHGSGRRLRGDPVAQLVALHLLTCPASTMIGLYYMPITMIAHELGLPLDTVSAALDRVSAAGFAVIDPATDLVWVFNAAEFEFGDGKKLGPKREKGISNQLRPFGKHPFIRDFLHRYGEAYRITAKWVTPAPLPKFEASNDNGIDTLSAFGHQGIRGSGDQGEQGSEENARAPKKVPIGSNHPEVAFAEAHYRQKFPGALSLDDDGRADLGRIIHKCAENKIAWQNVLDGFAEDRWAFANGSLSWLSKHLGEVTVWLANGRPKKSGGSSPQPFGPIAGSVTSDETKARQRQSAEKQRELDAARERRSDPEMAKDQVAKILSSIR